MKPNPGDPAAGGPALAPPGPPAWQRLTASGPSSRPAVPEEMAPSPGSPAVSPVHIHH